MRVNATMRLAIGYFIFCCAIIQALSYSVSNGNSNLLRVCYYTLDNPLPSKLNTTLCTHIIAGFSDVKDGVIDLGNETRKKLYLETTNLKTKDPLLKVLLTVGGGGNNNGFSDAVNSTWNRTRLIVSILSALSTYNFDGLDIDWEFPVWNDKILNDKENFVYFLQEFKVLAKAYADLVGKEPALLTVAVAAPETIVDSAYDIPQMAKFVDFINLMTYDFHDFFWYTPFTGHNSPLFNRSVEKAYFATLNTAWAADYWNDKGMPKSKIMVGVPTYAHTYELIDPADHGVDAPAKGTKGDLTFTDVCKVLASGGIRVFDEESGVPFAYRGYDWISYEDPVSIFGKARWIKSQGYGGVMTYDLNSDDWSCVCDKTPFLLHRIIYEVFTQ